jgi:uncharacterized protein (TIGR02599 family)
VVSPRDSLTTGSGGGRNETYSTIAPDYKYDSNEPLSGAETFSQQVPPLVRVTMVAIDEASAVRLENDSQMPDIIDDQLFRNTNRYEEDVQTLINSLNEQGINHKVFSSMVMLRSAKWSEY